MQAILITAYKNYTHLEKLIKYFNNNFSIYIHIDKKSNFTNDDIDQLRQLKNVKYISQKYKVNWGGINHLKAILNITIKAAEDEQNSYFHLITGHDYPIQALDKFEVFEKENTELNYMEYHSLPYANWPEGGMDRLSLYNFYDHIDGRKGIGERLVKGIAKGLKMVGLKRRFYKGFPALYGGSTYWSLNRDAIEYVINYNKENPQYLKRFKYSFCSEEIFFQTILLNSPLQKTIINDNKRFIVWETRNGNYPANLDESDYKDIDKSEHLFARKFEYPVSEALLRKIQTLINRTSK